MKERGIGTVETVTASTDFLSRIKEVKEPVILLEGTRNLPDEDKPKLVHFAERLAELLPRARFRTGNATGTDEAFAEGVKNIDPKRLQYVLPYKTMGRKRIHPQSGMYSLEDVPATEAEEIYRQTMEATPENAHLIELYTKVRKRNRTTVKALYLIRDALKVVGSKSLSLAPAAAGIFYVDMEKPSAGGTGHTIRLCRQNGVPVRDQTAWMKWPVTTFIRKATKNMTNV